MQISDEMLLPCPFCNSAPNPVPQNGDVPLPGGNGYFQTIWCERCGAEGGKRKTEADAIEAWNRRAALSLPVQPVAWPEGFFKLGGDNRLRECASDGCHQHVSIRVERGGVGSDHCEPCARKIADLLTTPPVPPTKGPEDDLIAALEGVKVLISNARGLYAKLAYEKIDKLLALRSRPASALPVVGAEAERDTLLAQVEALTGALTKIRAMRTQKPNATASAMAAVAGAALTREPS